MIFAKRKKALQDQLAEKDKQIIELQEKLEEKELTPEEQQELEALQKEVEEKTLLIEQADAKLKEMKNSVKGGGDEKPNVPSKEQIESAKLKLQSILNK